MLNQPIQTKKCSKCLVVKSLTEFYKNCARKDGYTHYCKICANKNHRQYRQKYPDKVKKARKLSYLQNIERTKITNKKYRTNPLNKLPIKYLRQKYYLLHKKQEAKNCNTYQKNRRKYDNGFKLLMYTRNYLNSKLNHALKFDHTINLLGCTGNEYKQYIESQFYNDMTWDKQGKSDGHWQIHHICPLEFFNQNDPVEQRQAWHYTNTKPLWYKDHCEEHKKINERMTSYL